MQQVVVISADLDESAAEVWYEAIILIFLMFLMDTFKMNSIFSASHHSTEHTQHKSLQSLDPGV